MSDIIELFRLAYHGFTLVKEAVDKRRDQKREEKRWEAISALNHNENDLKNPQALSKLFRDPAPKPDQPTSKKDSAF